MYIPSAQHRCVGRPGSMGVDYKLLLLILMCNIATEIEAYIDHIYRCAWWDERDEARLREIYVGSRSLSWIFQNNLINETRYIYIFVNMYNILWLFIINKPSERKCYIYIYVCVIVLSGNNECIFMWVEWVSREWAIMGWWERQYVVFYTCGGGADRINR